MQKKSSLLKKPKTQQFLSYDSENHHQLLGTINSKLLSKEYENMDEQQALKREQNLYNFLQLVTQLCNKQLITLAQKEQLKNDIMHDKKDLLPEYENDSSKQKKILLRYLSANKKHQTFFQASPSQLQNKQRYQQQIDLIPPLSQLKQQISIEKQKRKFSLPQVQELINTEKKEKTENFSLNEIEEDRVHQNIDIRAEMCEMKITKLLLVQISIF